MIRMVDGRMKTIWKRRKIKLVLTSMYSCYDQQSSKNGKPLLLPAGTIGAQATIQGKSNHLDFVKIELLMDWIASS